MTPGYIWKIQDMIKGGSISFTVGDSVLLFTKRHDGYPKYLEVGTTGIVKSVELNHLIVEFKSLDIQTTLRMYKLPKKFFANKEVIRDIKLNEILR